MMSEYMVYLLAKGINNGGWINTEDAYDVYNDDKTAARASLIRLINMGNIKLSGTPGIFIVKKAPEASFDLAKSLKGKA